jgi:hypothetical protein
MTFCSEPIDGVDEDTIAGIECHIVAQEDSPSVARSVSVFNPAEIEEYTHLIEDRHAPSIFTVSLSRDGSGKRLANWRTGAWAVHGLAFPASA